MPKAPKKGSARFRKERFSQDELQMLVDTLHEHAGTVFNSNMRREAVLRKKEIWALVGQKVSAVGNTPRTVEDCHKRWDDLRLWVRNILSANRTQALETGGGPSSPIKLTPWEETCASMIGPESIEGVGEMECGATSSADGGSEHDSEEHDTTPAEDTNRPSISRGQARGRRVPARKPPQRHIPPATPRPVEGTAPHPSLHCLQTPVQRPVQRSPVWLGRWQPRPPSQPKTAPMTSGAPLMTTQWMLSTPQHNWHPPRYPPRVTPLIPTPRSSLGKTRHTDISVWYTVPGRMSRLGMPARFPAGPLVQPQEHSGLTSSLH
ncbi:myb-related transcription factor, partner of profilin-like [Ambystoma mexicanum]|uniref:myb-related transcription factor, partner of profilin-like n=1 Tax=Ambystoma mexicanum TaxID=8296 RepID=UPI0037E8FDD7